MAEYIKKEDALDCFHAWVDKYGDINLPDDMPEYRAIENLPAADVVERKKGKWIPVTSRPMDEEERAEWSEKIGYDIEYEDAIIYTSQLPDDGEEVLTCNKYGYVRIDTFNNDPEYGCYFEENGDMDGIVAWMPKPKPYKPPKEES